MSLSTGVQYGLHRADLPSETEIQSWAGALSAVGQHWEVTVRIVDEVESAALNLRFRGQAGPTNVLSFPFEAPAVVELSLLGDLVICAPVVAREAREQAKPEVAHWAHMVVHGLLHLLGYDHQVESDAALMEARETEVLALLGYADPYAVCT